MYLCLLAAANEILLSYRIQRDQELNMKVKEIGVIEAEVDESGKELP
jgi:hypothetical protein